MNDESTLRPIASILLPCRNAEATIDEAMASLVTQTLQDVEIICVDDGSTDHTAARLACWARRDSRVRVVHTPPAGIVAALTTAAHHARGAILARMDADDVAHEERLQRQVEWLHHNPSASACGTLIRYFPTGWVRNGARQYEQWINSIVTSDDIERDLFVECPIPHPSLSIRASAFEAINGYRDASWPEDYDLILRLSTSGHRLGKVPQELLRWRERPDRLSRVDPRYSQVAFRRCKAHYLAHRIRGRFVVVCGAGPVGKAMARQLQEHNHHIAAFVDLDPRKIGQTIHGAPVVAARHIDRYRGAYVLAAVASPLERQRIRAWLRDAGMQEVDDFCAVA